jgi:hypothetical protein
LPGGDRGFLSVFGEDLDQQPLSGRLEGGAVAFLDNDAGGGRTGERREELQARSVRADTQGDDRNREAGLPVAAAASSRSTTAAAASLLRGWAAADAGPSIAIRRRARSTMKSSILDPLSDRRGRKHAVISPGARAARDQAWDR